MCVAGGRGRGGRGAGGEGGVGRWLVVGEVRVAYFTGSQPSPLASSVVKAFICLVHVEVFNSPMNLYGQQINHK